MTKVKMIVLPQHVLFHYIVDPGGFHMNDLKVTHNAFCLRLSGIWQQTLNDPNNYVASGEKSLQLTAPSVVRGGYDIKATATSATGGEVICLVPKSELSKIMHPDSVATVLQQPDFTVMADV